MSSKPQIAVADASCIAGTPIRLRISNLVQTVEISWDIHQVRASHSSFRLGSNSIIQPANETDAVALPETAALEPGLYIFGRIEIIDPASGVRTAVSGLELEKFTFEVRDQASPAKTMAQVQSEIEEIWNQRVKKLAEGIGSGPRWFRLAVFVRDILLTVPMNLGTYEVGPIGGLPMLDQLAVVEEFMAKIGITPQVDATELHRSAQAGQPAIAAIFQKVCAPTIEEALDLAEAKVNHLVVLLALQKKSAGGIFASVAQESTGGPIKVRFRRPTYRGNLLGGSISGEDVGSTLSGLQVLEEAPQVGFFLRLYHGALLEPRPDYRYVLLWTILETIARSKEYSGRPVRDWAGNVRKNRRGDPMVIETEAVDLVYEMLREHLSRDFSGSSFQQSVKRSHFDQLVTIWYRRRNCFAHGSPCYCKDQGLPYQGKPNYVACRDASLETQGGPDRYLEVLQQTVELVLSCEIQAHRPRN